MILTVTPVPTLDRKALMANPLGHDTKVELDDITTLPGGVGVAVAHIIFLAGRTTKAVFPAPEVSHFERITQLVGLPHTRVDVPGPVQIRFVVEDSEHTITEFLDPAMPLSATQLALLRDATVTDAEQASTVLLAGPLPAVAPGTWYTEVIRALKLYHPQVRTVLATTGRPLAACVRQLSTTAPAVIVARPDDLVPGATIDGDASTLVNAARGWVRQGVDKVIVYGGRAAAIAITADQAVVARSARDVHRIDAEEMFIAGCVLAADGHPIGEAAIESIASGLAYTLIDGDRRLPSLPTHIEPADAGVTLTHLSPPVG